MPNHQQASTIGFSGSVLPKLEDALKTFDREQASVSLAAAAAQREEIQRRFPLADWPSLPLERYALGQEGQDDNYCRWLEFLSPDLGSMRGGNSTKLVVYKKKSEPGWFFYQPPGDAKWDEQQAWRALRNGFVEMFDLAGKGAFDGIDAVEGLAFGPVLKTKTLHVYFPESVLPVYSTAHIKHFLALLDPSDIPGSAGVVDLNRRLLAGLRARPELAEWTTGELGLLLYHWADPRLGGRVVKIAPGESGKYWDECLAGGYICVGWDKVGDLTAFETEAQFREVFTATYGQNQPNSKVKAAELWSLRTLEPGDYVVANRGISHVLGLGTVIEPGYVWDESRPHFRHTVRVKWDTTYGGPIPPQKKWAFQTVGAVSPQLRQLLATKSAIPTAVPVPDLYREMAQALDRRGQAVLYGPPGTGKTFHALQFAVFWLCQSDGAEAASTILADPNAFSNAKASLGPRLKRLSFHPSYSYEDFVEGFRPAQVAGGGLALQLEDGVFKRACADAAADPDHNHLLVIDEINRANVAKVFGELITLIEKDKRGLVVQLAQSKAEFSIPSNLFLLGTMNTADRSIRLLDAAMRRRFAFIELMPDPSALGECEVLGLPMDDLLAGLNRKVREHGGREKQVGHAYFMQGGKPLTDETQFAHAFCQEVVPLLQEYFYDDYSLLARVLGPGIVDEAECGWKIDVLNDPERLVDALRQQFVGAE